MTTPLSLVPQRRPDGTTVLAASGEIDMGNAPVLAAALGETPDRLVLDLTAVEYLDSAGIAVLFDHADHLELVASPLLSPVLTVSGLGDIAKIHHEEA